MPTVIGKKAGFKFCINSTNVQKVVVGDKYTIPEHLLKTWADKCGYFERVEQVIPDIDPKDTKAKVVAAKAGKAKSKGGAKVSKKESAQVEDEVK